MGGEGSELEYDKVFHNGSVVVGLAGAIVDSQTFRYTDLPELDTWDIDRWVTEKLAKRVKKKTKYHGAILAEVGGRVYIIGQEGSWVRNTSGIYAIGSGADYAMGAMLSGASPGQAVLVAAQLDLGTGGTIVMATSKEIRSGHIAFDEEEEPKKAKKKKKDKKK
jgi:ATP-dependent protease HslVU (ClpYQ) peptidase subunit